MCLGKSKDKAGVLFNLCMGPKLAKIENDHNHETKKDEKKAHKSDTITWKNARLI